MLSVTGSKMLCELTEEPVWLVVSMAGVSTTTCVLKGVEVESLAAVIDVCDATRAV
jgi:hypothetical protein